MKKVLSLLMVVTTIGAMAAGTVAGGVDDARITGHVTATGSNLMISTVDSVDNANYTDEETLNVDLDTVELSDGITEVFYIKETSSLTGDLGYVMDTVITDPNGNNQNIDAVRIEVIWDENDNGDFTDDTVLYDGQLENLNTNPITVDLTGSKNEAVQVKFYREEFVNITIDSYTIRFSEEGTI